MYKDDEGCSRDFRLNLKLRYSIALVRTLGVEIIQEIS